MNILQVTTFFYPDSIGGSNRVVYELSKALAARGHEVHVMTRRIDASFPVHEELDGMHVHRYAGPGHRWLIRNFHAIFNIPRLYWQLRQTLDFDVINYHDLFSALGINLATRGQDVPKVATNYSLGYLETIIENPTIGVNSLKSLVHGYLVQAYSRVLKSIEYWNLRQAANIIVLGDFSKYHLKHYLRFQDQDITIIPGGVDLQKFHPREQDRAALKEDLGIAGHRPVLFTVRRLAHRMGLENLIQAMVLVKQEHPDVLLLIGGQGHLKEHLQDLVFRFALTGTVKLLGLVPESRLIAYYQAADFFILPTLSLEGFGLIILEALACGCPVLGTPVGNIPYLLNPLSPDLVFPDSSPGAMAVRINSMLSDPEKLQVLRPEGVRYAKAHFQWDYAAAMTEKLFLNLGAGAQQNSRRMLL